MKSLLNDDTAQYLKKIDYTSTWSVAHHMRFLAFANYIVSYCAKTVLDVGFGQDVLVNYLADAHFKGEYLGVDLNQEYVTAATVRTFRSDHTTGFFQTYKLGGIEAAQTADTRMKYNVIVLGEVIEHIKKDEAVAFLKQCADMLAPGGRILLSTPNKINGKLNWPEDHEDEYEFDELVETCVMSDLCVDKAVGLWNNTDQVGKMMTMKEADTYASYMQLVPRSLLNVLMCIQHPERSRAVLLVLRKA